MYSRTSVTESAQTIQRTYIVLTVVTTLATSFIWGINTLFLLDAGLTNTEAFAANAFYAVGQVLFEVPTGVVADTRGRRFSFMLGAATLLGSTFLYYVMWLVQAPFIGWAIASMLLGLGFTFFSGATVAWLVDALAATRYQGNLETVLGRGQTASGVAMLTGTVLGGVVAQATDLGAPYLLRAAMLGLAVLVAAKFMHDIGFSPRRGASAAAEVRSVVRGSIDAGWRNPPVRALMLAAPFTYGVGFFAFYASQPYLLQLYGDPDAYSVAGLMAAIFAGAQIIGGLSVPLARRVFRRRTDALLLATVTAVVVFIAVGSTGSFPLAVALLAGWALLYALEAPIRQSFVNGVIPSEQRATVLSFDNLMGAIGGAVAQPGLGRVADVYGYGPSYIVAGVVQAFAIPFVALARRARAVSDPIEA
jgi:MFS family permease